MSNGTNELTLKLENYVLQLRQVEAALQVDPTHVELLKIKADLNELIDLTKNLIKSQVNEGASFPKRARRTSGDDTEPSASKSDEITSLPENKINTTESEISSRSHSDEADVSKCGTSATASNNSANICHETSQLIGAAKNLKKSASSTRGACRKTVERSGSDSDISSEGDKDVDNIAASLHVEAYDKDGNRFTLADYLNKKVTDKKLLNYFAKHKRRLNQMCINDHRIMHGLEPLKFRRNRGNKNKTKHKHNEDP